MQELFVIYLWENKLLQADLQTTDGEKLEIVHAGFRNQHAGPDFSQARVKIGKTLWAGNVEVHLNESDWYKHRHHLDKAYDNIILHVVYQADKAVYNHARKKIPCLEVKGKFDSSILLNYRAFIDSKRWIACENMLKNVQAFSWMSWIDRMVAERLEEKTKRVLAIFEQCGNDWEETLYRSLMINFGFHTNEAAFEQLSRILPLHLLLRHADQLFQLEALLLGQAGFLEAELSEEYPLKLQQEFWFLSQKYGLKPMDSASWRFLRLRPANFPGLRLAQLAALVHKNGQIFSKILQAKDAVAIRSLFKVKTSAYWDDHYRFGKSSSRKAKTLGDDAISLLMINSVVHILFAYGHYNRQAIYSDKALGLLESLKAENNQIVRGFAKAGIQAVNALQSQGLLHLKKNYCKPKNCLECRIGQILLKTGKETI